MAKLERRAGCYSYKKKYLLFYGGLSETIQHFKNPFYVSKNILHTGLPHPNVMLVEMDHYDTFQSLKIL